MTWRNSGLRFSQNGPRTLGWGDSPARPLDVGLGSPGHVIIILSRSTSQISRKTVNGIEGSPICAPEKHCLISWMGALVVSSKSRLKRFRFSVPFQWIIITYSKATSAQHAPRITDELWPAWCCDGVSGNRSRTEHQIDFAQLGSARLPPHRSE